MSQKKWICLLVLFILIVFNAAIRIYHVLPWWCSKDANNTAKQELYAEFKVGIDKAYIDLNPDQKKILVERQFNNLLNNKKLLKQKAKIKQTQKQAYHKNADGLPYFTNLDSYHNLHLVKLILKNGFPGTNKVGTKLIDEYISAPKGLEVTKTTFFYYLSAYIYRALNFVIPMSLEKFCFYFPLFWLIVFLVLLYVFIKRFSSVPVALLTVFFTGTASNFLFRTLPGWYDTDIVNVLFPLIISCLLFNSKPKFKPQNCVFACMFAFVYLYQWSFAFLFFAILLIGYLLSELHSYNFINRIEVKKNIIIGFMFVTMLLLILINLYHGSFTQLLTIFSKTYDSFWPNTYLTITELQQLDINGLAANLHGVLLLSLSFLYPLIVLIKRKKVNVCFFIMLCWYIVMLFASFKAMRATFYLAIPVSFFLSSFFVSSLKSIKTLKRVVVRRLLMATIGLMLTISIVASSQRAFALTMQPFSLMNDSWYDFLIKAKENTEQNAIINSWWDYGSFYTSIAERSVIVDGNSQGGILPYWVSRALITGNLSESIAILKILNNSSIDIFYTVYYALDCNWERSLTLINSLLNLDQKKAAEMLDRYLGLHEYYDELKVKILDIFYKIPDRPVYVAIDKTMIEKMYRITFLGNWNFPKAYICKNKKNIDNAFVRSKFLEDFGLTSNVFDNLLSVARYQESACSPSQLSKSFGFGKRIIPGTRENNYIVFENKFFYDIANERLVRQEDDLFVQNTFIFDGVEIYASHVLSDGRGVVDMRNGRVVELDAAIFGVSPGTCVMYKSVADNWSLVELPHPQMVDSLISRLFFFQGKGLEDKFELVVIDADHEQLLFKVNF